MLSPFAPAFLAAEARAARFLPVHFRDPAARAQSVEQARGRRVSAELIRALEVQHAQLPPSPARRRNLEALATPGTCAVVTGQQVALFLGPLYSVYKAASAVAAAQTLERETGVRCVPLFWLQTEDHDFEEVNHCHVLTPEGEVLRLAVGEEPGDAGEAGRVSVKHRLLGPEVLVQVQRLEAAWGQHPAAAELLGLLRAHYRPEVTLADAFARVMAALFAEEGLLFLDPRDPAIARLAAPLHRRALDSAGPLTDLLQQRARELADAGFAAQVHVRPGSPLWFFHPERAEGGRYRLEPEGSGWRAAGAEVAVSAALLERCLADEPLRFSSSALLRPLVQDSLLPTAAYVGGPGEINYFAQTPPLYAHFGLPAPLIVPRARFRLLDARTRALLETLQVTPPDLEHPRDQVLAAVSARHPSRHPAPDALRGDLLAGVTRALDDFATSADALHLGDAVKRTRGTIEHAVSRLVGRYDRGLLLRDQTMTDRVDRLQTRLFPHKMPQERFFALPSFACKAGHRALKEQLFAALQPFSAQLTDLPL